MSNRSFLWFAMAMFLPAAASAAEIQVQPGDNIQDALQQAMPGDVVIVAAGEYQEALETTRDGDEGNPITLRGDGEVVIRASGRVLDVQHAYFTVEDVTLDGDYGDRDAVRVGDGGDHLFVRQTEIRRSGRDCVDMGDVDGVRFDGTLIHHCLNWDGERVDAHGITGAVVTDLAIVDTEIHTFTGDALQFDPGRSAPGWTDVTVRGCNFWLEPLAEAANGVPAGTVPGENAIDTKTNDDAAPANLTVENTIAHGFRGGLISNMAAFNIKENVRAHFDGVQVWNSEIAFRLRGATGSRPNGAVVSIYNTVVSDVDKAVRYEDDVQEPIVIYNTTFGLDVTQAFQNASAPDDVLDVRNLLTVGMDEAQGDGNFEATIADFVDAANRDYEPVAEAPFLDRGETLDDVETDLRGVPRPFGTGYDPGAYEYTDEPTPDPDADAGPGPDPDMAGMAGMDDAGGDGADAGGPDADTDVGDPRADSAGSGGCGCRQSPDSMFPAALLVLFLLILGFRSQFAPGREIAPRSGMNEASESDDSARR